MKASLYYSCMLIAFLMCNSMLAAESRFNYQPLFEEIIKDVHGGQYNTQHAKYLARDFLAFIMQGFTSFPKEHRDIEESILMRLFPTEFQLINRDTLGVGPNEQHEFARVAIVTFNRLVFKRLQKEVNWMEIKSTLAKTTKPQQMRIYLDKTIRDMVNNKKLLSNIVELWSHKNKGQDDDPFVLLDCIVQ